MKVFLTIVFGLFCTSAFPQWSVSGTNIYNSNTGHVGIGTSSPSARLHVHDDTLLPQASGSFQMLSRISGRSHNHFSQCIWLLRDASSSIQWWTTRLHDGISIDGSFLTPGIDTRTWWERDPMDNIQSWGHGNEVYMTINQGNLGIGTTSPNQKLTVNGTIYGKEVKVDLNVPGPDYVFEVDYDLPSLDELQAYISQNKHLPEVPSAKEMEQEGINLSEMNMILLKKVEELTLYVIELKKEIESIKNPTTR